MMTETNMNRIPLVLDPDGRPFVFHNTDLHRIEFVHGNTMNIIRLSKDTPVTVEPPVGELGFMIRDEEYNDCGSKPVYSKQAADYGEEVRDSRGHIFCSIKEYGPDDDIIITVKRARRHYFIYFAYSPWQLGEEKIA